MTQEPSQAAVAPGGDHTQQHPLGVYFKVWTLLFVLSACSYYVDYAGFEGFLRWFLIVVFMFLKAGFIVAVFMHMMWERMLLITAIILPPTLLLFLVGIMVLESEYTFWTRVLFFGLFDG
jgi:cytochrome c oxidase subunit 4